MMSILIDFSDFNSNLYQIGARLKRDSKTELGDAVQSLEILDKADMPCKLSEHLPMVQ